MFQLYLFIGALLAITLIVSRRSYIFLRDKKLRFKEEGQKKTGLAHTLNGSALALPRIVAALLENNQTQEGIKIPEALVDYTGFDLIN